MTLTSNRILIVTPAPRGSRKGNRISAERWGRMLREVGWNVAIAGEFEQQTCDLLVALHARKSADSVARFRRVHPDKPLVLVLTGTDLYSDLRTSRKAMRSVELATQLVLLQPHGVEYLPDEQRAKARAIYQSATPPRRLPKPRQDCFEVCVSGHLRPVKDPFRAALAARQLPSDSRIRIVHLGRALSAHMEQRARREMAINPRYEWLGELAYERAKQRLARSRLLVLSSKMEGGANVISEAIVCGVPVLASRISGSMGLLGENYPGFFRVGDTGELRDLLLRVEREPQFLQQLKRTCRERRALFTPQRERAEWHKLVRELLPRA